MLVGFHTHYQMHLASKFTLFFMKFDPTQAVYLQIQLNFMKTDTFFYKKLPCFIKNCIWPTYKKLQPPKSAIIRNSIFEINRDPSSYIFLNLTLSPDIITPFSLLLKQGPPFSSTEVWSCLSLTDAAALVHFEPISLSLRD